MRTAISPPNRRRSSAIPRDAGTSFSNSAPRAGLARSAKPIRAAAAHLAVARADVVTRVDLDSPSLGAFDPVTGNVSFTDAEITIGEAPGLGITAIAGLEPVPA